MPLRRKILLGAQPRRPLGRPRAEDVADLEARLLLVARANFFAHGYGATSMSAIARAARASKNTLYARFPSKASLFRAIVTEQIQHMENQFRRAAGNDVDTLRESLRLYGKQMLKASLAGELLQLNRLLYSESDRFPELGEAAAARAEIGKKQVAALLRRFARKEKYACRDPEAAAEVYIMMLRGWYNQVLLTNRKVTLADQAAWVEKVVDIFLASRSRW